MTPCALAFGELEAFTSSLAAILLTFFNARVAGKKAFASQTGAVLRSRFGKGAGNTVADCSNLSGNTTASDQNQNIETSHGISGLEAGEDLLSETGTATDVVFDGTTINGHLTCAGYQTHPGRGALSSSGADVLNYASHLEIFFLSLKTILISWRARAREA